MTLLWLGLASYQGERGVFRIGGRRRRRPAHRACALESDGSQWVRGKARRKTVRVQDLIIRLDRMNGWTGCLIRALPKWIPRSRYGHWSSSGGRWKGREDPDAHQYS